MSLYFNVFSQYFMFFSFLLIGFIFDYNSIEKQLVRNKIINSIKIKKNGYK